MDWKLCIICQQNISKALKCPLSAEGSGDKSGAYTSFLANVSEFEKLNQLPVPLNFRQEMELEQLVTNEAKWHKSCHLKFNSSKLERARKRAREETRTDSSKRCRLQRQSLPKSYCIFCSKGDGHLHEFRTLDADDNLRRMAADLQDTALLARIEGGDLTALEAKYHFSCLTAFRNRHRSFLRQLDSSNTKLEQSQIEARAFVELITHMENYIEDDVFCFKFSSLHQMYEERLHNLGISKEVNRSRFKERILEHFPNAQEQSDGKNVIIVFDQGLQQMMKKSVKCNYEEKVLILKKAANIVRNDIFSSSWFSFNGAFPHGCQQGSVPDTLKLLVMMLLQGSDIKDQKSSDSQVCLSISQAILFNCSKRIAAENVKSRHSLVYEPPLPLYIGLNVHTQTRSKKLVQELYELGLSVSYTRILQIENQLATAVCEDSVKKGVVCPSQMRKGVFTTSGLDNMDHNTSSTTAQGNFHGTSISLFQNPTASEMEHLADIISLLGLEKKKQLVLPESFTSVPAIALKKDTIMVPQPPNEIEPITGYLEGAQAQEKCWQEHAVKLMDKEQIVEGDVIAWSAYHASLQTISDDVQPVFTQLFPLFSEKAATPAMIKHGMDVIRKATQFLNPGQIPVIAMDAPLFAIAKFVQWNWPQTHGESKFVIMFGGLHIEMAIWNTIGDYLEASGWTAVLTQAGIATSGTADSFLKAAHLTRTRHAHQVTALALSRLQQDAFLLTEGPHDESTREAWRQTMITKSPTFQYWDTILKLETLVLVFVRAHREKNFPLYVESLKSIAPWFFALDHQNYARWIPIHIRDMESLPDSVSHEFIEHGRWVISKTKNRFSAMPIDQAHEQNNALVKGSGGAIGLTENPSAFRKWTIAGPEQARLLKEFEREFASNPVQTQQHHEEGFSIQKAFKEQAVSLVQTITEMGNPFLDDTSELLMLDTRNVMDDSVVKTVRNVESVGIEQCNNYIESVIKDRTCSIHESIKKNSLPLFRCPTPKTKNKKAGQISMLKHDVELFSRLYIVMQHRQCDMTTFFKHENHPYPPSLSDHGKIRSGTKSDLLNILVQEMESEPSDLFDVRVLDGAAIVHFLPVSGISTFEEYANEIFIPYIKKQLETSQRVDVVWDTYISRSIKESTREKRGRGVQRKVEDQNKIPSNWPDFLRDSINKTELFAFLSSKIAVTNFAEGKQVFATSGTTVISRGTNRCMELCDHEEADTRIVVHLQDALRNGSSSCMVRTVDTDVVVIIIGKFHAMLSNYPAANIWVAFGTRKRFQYIHINAICSTLGPQKSIALPVFHSFTGCDTTSAFLGKGKKSAWEAWKSYPEVTQAFLHIARHPFSPLKVDDQHFKLLEHFCVVLYDKTSTLETVNKARQELFCQKSRTMELIPPTQNALLEHCKRVVYQAGIWTTSELAQQHTPSPEGNGWTMDEESSLWLPVWTSLPMASKACTELVKCGCKSAKGCGARCSCKKANWNCTQLCSCQCAK